MATNNQNFLFIEIPFLKKCFFLDYMKARMPDLFKMSCKNCWNFWLEENTHFCVFMVLLISTFSKKLFASATYYSISIV